VGPYLLSDVQVCKPKTLTVPRETPFKPISLHASGNFEFLKKENYMSESNKNVVRRLFEEVWNKGNLQVTDELFTPNYAQHDASTPDVGRGPDSEKKRATLYRTAFPDIRLTVEDIIAEGETVVARWSCRGTHKGDLNGIAPTGKQFNVTGVSVARFTNGKMSEGFVNWDALSLMQQLGVVPELAKIKAAAATR
jgi:steroid delta-isomerase-like uncharacterized protein